MLYDLDLTLEQLLKSGLPNRFDNSSSGSAIAITFVTPNPEFIIKLPALNLFLYDIRENQEIRSSSWSVTRQNNGTAIRKPSPVRIDCSYLMTMWPSDPKDFATEHQLLGEVMRVLMSYPKLPSTILQGSLANCEPPWRASVLGQVKLQSLGEFWQAMGGKPKATLNYTVTISVPVDTEGQTLPLVAGLGSSND